MQILGIDLSGPGSPQNTALAAFHLRSDHLEYEALITSVDDQVLCDEVQSRLEADDVTIGLDAPLSYGRGGGQRQSDRELRRLIVEQDLLPGSVMPPTAPRMVYLTLRGISVARSLEWIGTTSRGKLRIVETHPGAALALGGAPTVAIRGFRGELLHRRTLLQWLRDRGLHGIGKIVASSDHSVAACAAAWATWGWLEGKSHWVSPAVPPHHPYDFTC